MTIASEISERNEKRTLSVGLASQKFSMFEMSYFLLDITHCLFVGNLLEDKLYEESINLYSTLPYRYRLEQYNELYRDSINIQKLSKESPFDLIVSGIGTVASIVTSVTLHEVNRRQQINLNDDQKYYINVKTNDPEILDFMNQFEEKMVPGSFENNFIFMREFLELKGHSIEPVSDHVFNVIQKGINRIDRTINKTFQI